MNIKKIVLIVVGCIGLGLGVVGAIVPLLPAFPFLLVAGLCFAKSSQKLNDWLIGTKLYKNNLESFLKKQGMTWQTKLRVIITITLLMGFGFYMMSEVLVGRIVLSIVWLFHIVYFVFFVKNRQKNTEPKSEEIEELEYDCEGEPHE